MAKRTCSVEDCDKSVRVQGLCATHTYRMRRHGTTDGVGKWFRGTPEERFVRMVEVDEVTGCHVWTGALSDGYGCFNLGDGKKSYRAHRFSYEMEKGPIPEDFVLDHLCRNRACVNPEHLEAVTSRENTLRGENFSALNARKTSCPKGHPYDEENTYITPDGTRQCAKCRRSAVAVQQQDAKFREARRESYTPSTGVRGQGAYQKEKTECPKGHEYNEANTLTEKRKKPDGSIREVRKCRTCVNAKKAAWRANGGVG